MTEQQPTPGTPPEPPTPPTPRTPVEPPTPATPATPAAPATLGATTETPAVSNPGPRDLGVEQDDLRRSPEASGAGEGSARGVLVASGRVALSLVAATAAAALAAGVLLVPAPAAAPAVPAATITPERADQTLVCAGGALGLTRGDDPQPTVVAAPDRAAFGTGLVESALTTSTAADGGAAVVTLPREAPGDGLAAAESVRADTLDVSGLAASECLSPGRSAWLVGGSTTVGRTTWIVLSNADVVDAVVDLRLWGERGPIEAVGVSGIIVAAGTQRVVPLAGIAVDEPSPVVQVTSSGGSIAATLQTSIVRGLDPDGLSVITPVASPAARHVIPALPVIGLEAALERFSADGAADAFTALRMLAPGDVPVDVTVTLVPEQGALGLTTQTTLDPGVVLDLPFSDLTDGEYGVVVEASAPIVVAARTSVVGTSGADVEWFTPAAALSPGDEVLAAVAPLGVGPAAGQRAVLHLLAPGGADVDIDGLAVSVPPGAVVTVPVASEAGLRIRTTGALHASVTYRGDGLLAGSRVAPRPTAAGVVTVLPG